MGDLDLLAGRRILVAEDDYFIAQDLACALEEAGALVVGPAASLSEALELIERAEALDGAVLDLNLQGEMAYPAADALLRRAVPFVFTTGYDRGVIAARFSDVPACRKPFAFAQVARALFG